MEDGFQMSMTDSSLRVSPGEAKVERHQVRFDRRALEQTE